MSPNERIILATANRFNRETKEKEALRTWKNGFRWGLATGMIVIFTTALFLFWVAKTCTVQQSKPKHDRVHVEKLIIAER